MATADGYAPYPLNLTALQVKDAITRAFNLDTEFLGKVSYFDTPTPPALSALPNSIKTGDFWHDSSTGINGDKLYQAKVDNSDALNPVLVLFEV